MQEYNLELMIQGHEIWLEQATNSTGAVELALLFGHNMRQDGMVDKERFIASVFHPDGTKGEMELTTCEDRHFLTFTPDMDGYFTAYADMGVVIYSKTGETYNEGPKFRFKDVTYSGAYHQMAKIIVPSEHPGEYVPQAIHGILEIVPSIPVCTVGAEMELTVYYEDKPLTSTTVKVISKKEGKDIASVQTDDQGIARIQIPSDGEWMFLVRHTDPTKKVNEEFDESVFITTLVLEAR